MMTIKMKMIQLATTIPSISEIYSNILDKMVEKKCDVAPKI